MMLTRFPAAALLLAARRLHRRAEFRDARMAVARLLVRQEGGADPAGAEHADRRTDRSELVEPVQRSACSPRWRRRSRARTWTCRWPPSGSPSPVRSSASWVRRSFPTLNANGSYTRQKASDVGVFANSPNALGANGASGSNAGGIRSAQLNAFDVYQVGFDASWEVDLWGQVRRSVESATASVVASAEARRATLLSSLAELARDYIQLRGVQSLLRIARDNVKIAQQSLQLTQQRAAGRGDHRSRRGECRRAAAHHRGGDPTAGAAGIGVHQRHQPAAGPAAERAAGGADPGEAGAAGAAAYSGRSAVRTGAAAARHPPGRGAAARGHRRYRRRGGEFLSVGEAVRQSRAAVDPAVADVQPRTRATMPSGPASPSRSSRVASSGRPWRCARRSSRRRRSTTRRPC